MTNVAMLNHAQPDYANFTQADPANGTGNRCGFHWDRNGFFRAPVKSIGFVVAPPSIIERRHHVLYFVYPPSTRVTPERKFRSRLFCFVDQVMRLVQMANLQTSRNHQR
jgi:hypothetical protein